MENRAFPSSSCPHMPNSSTINVHQQIPYLLQHRSDFSSPQDQLCVAHSACLANQQGNAQPLVFPDILDAPQLCLSRDSPTQNDIRMQAFHAALSHFTIVPGEASSFAWPGSTIHFLLVQNIMHTFYDYYVFLSLQFYQI